jgi:hypothetical protein
MWGRIRTLKMDIVRFVYRPFTTRAARRALVGRSRVRQTPEAGRFTRADVDSLLRTAWTFYAERVGSLPSQPTIGSGMNIRLACFTLSFFDALLAVGTDRDYAIEIVADATWNVYQVWARVALAAARVTRGKTTSLGFAISGKRNGHGSVSLRFPFNAPGYLIEPVAVSSGTAFDVVRCPAATYFRGQGAVDLCTASWCNLDYPLSEMTHQTLVRTKTLVTGHDRCDFRITEK